MKFKAIIFDFDGLMFDSEKIWKKYFIEANKVFNANFTEQDRLETIGVNEQNIRKLLKTKHPNLDVDAYRDWMRKKVHQHFNTIGAEPKKGLNVILNYIQTNNLLTGIASGSEKYVISNILNKAGINENIFKSFVTGDRKIKPKPNPDVFLKVCEELGIQPHEAVVLEDSYNGVRAGHLAGCFTIMIPDTMPVTDEMKKTANLILNNLSEVVEFLNN